MANSVRPRQDISSSARARGGIGRHAGFRFLCLRVCGFKSRRAHVSTRLSEDYPWPDPLHDGLIGHAGFAPDVPWSSRERTDGPRRVPVLAVGSNASAGVLADKLKDVIAGSPHLPVAVEVCEVVGLAVGHSAHVSVRGYVAASPFLPDGRGQGPPQPGPTPTYSVGWFTADQLMALDATEPTYDRIVLPDQVTVTARAGRIRLSEVMVYRSRHGVLGEEGRPLPLCSQEQVHQWLAERLPHLAGRSSTALYADPRARERVRVELVRQGLVVSSGFS